MDQDQNGKVGLKKQAIRFEIFASNLNFIDIVQSYGLMQWYIQIKFPKIPRKGTTFNSFQVTVDEFVRACMAQEKISKMLTLKIIDIFLEDD